MSFPLLIFGFYCGLISKQFDHIASPIKRISFILSSSSKKIITAFLAALIMLTFYLTYFNWIQVNHKLNKINLQNDFSQISIVETPIYNSRLQSTLYFLGGRYFRKGRYVQSNAIDEQFLKFCPNQLDVLYR